MRPAAFRYSVTTLEPGASDVLTHGLRVRPSAAAFLATQACADHHARVRGVGAARDRRDDDRAMLELELVAFGIVHADAVGGGHRGRVRRGRVRALVVDLAEIAAPVRLHVGERDAVLRTRGACERWLNRREVKDELARVHRPSSRPSRQKPFCFAYASTVFTRPSGRPGKPQVGERLLVDREEADRRAVLGRHVGDGRAVRRAACRRGRGRRTRRTC